MGNLFRRKNAHVLTISAELYKDFRAQAHRIRELEADIRAMTEENDRLSKELEYAEQATDAEAQYADELKAEIQRLREHIEEMIDDVKGLGYGYPRTWEAY